MSRSLVFEASTPLDAPPARVFDFHQNPHNIRRVAPRSLRILEIEAEPVARVGGLFRVRARQFGFPMEWTGRWEIVEPPGLLVDSAIRCPFKNWRHEHHFFPKDGGGCRLADRVSFEPPAGALGAMIFRGVLAGMFRARHRATRAIFAGGGAPPVR